MEQLQIFENPFSEKELLNALNSFRNSPSDCYNYLKNKMCPKHALWRVLNYHFDTDYESIIEHNYVDVEINGTRLKFKVDFDTCKLYFNGRAICYVFDDENETFDEKFLKKIKMLIKKYVLDNAAQFFI